jgi:hypothetical protein
MRFPAEVRPGDHEREPSSWNQSQVAIHDFCQNVRRAEATLVAMRDFWPEAR